MKYVEDTILKQEEETGVVSEDLRQLRSDLREALALFNGDEPQIIEDPPVIILDETEQSITTDPEEIVLDDSEPASCLTLSSDSEDEDEIDEVLKEIAGKSMVKTHFSMFSVDFVRHELQHQCPLYYYWFDTS